MTDTLHALAEATGIATAYVDQTGQERVASPETLRAALAGMDLPAATEEEAAETLAALNARRESRVVSDWLVIEADRPTPLPFAQGPDWVIRTETGAELRSSAGAKTLPPLEPGYHLIDVEGDTALLMAVPPTPPLPARDWGVTVPLYGLRPIGQGGLGDYSELARAATALAGAGAAFVGLNPVHAGFLEDDTANSPYAPSHRRRLNVLHVAVDEDAAADGNLVDYPRARQAKRAGLEAEYAAFADGGGNESFESWVAAQGASLTRFATHQALSERHGAYWMAWPEELRDPDGEEVAAFAAEAEDRIRFHAWLQWRAEEQLLDATRAADAAGMAHGLYLDLAVGTHPSGAETWADRDSFASGVSLGAPPDAFSSEGQDWGLAPLNPRALVASNFRPLIETLRMQLRFARLLRIDHILGFDRAFWVPREAPGTYVAMPKQAMLAVARIEAHRAGATIIGEDLGNIPEGLHEDLDAAGLLGCRVAMFERQGDDGPPRPPEQWDERALASFSTHDLPTWLGWRAGRDIEWRRQLGQVDDETAWYAQEDRAREVAQFDAAIGGSDVDAMHAHLGRAASALAAVQIEDILGLEEQPNLPGTVDEHPNWRRRLPIGPDEFAADPRVARTGDIMGKTGR